MLENEEILIKSREIDNTRHFSYFVLYANMIVEKVALKMKY